MNWWSKETAKEAFLKIWAKPSGDGMISNKREVPKCRDPKVWNWKARRVKMCYHWSIDSFQRLHFAGSGVLTEQDFNIAVACPRTVTWSLLQPLSNCAWTSSKRQGNTSGVVVYRYPVKYDNDYRFSSSSTMTVAPLSSREVTGSVHLQASVQAIRYYPPHLALIPFLSSKKNGWLRAPGGCIPDETSIKATMQIRTTMQLIVED